jgi:hypothetical protein
VFSNDGDGVSVIVEGVNVPLLDAPPPPQETRKNGTKHKTSNDFNARIETPL